MSDLSDRDKYVEHRIYIEENGKAQWYWIVDEPQQIGTYSRVLGGLPSHQLLGWIMASLNCWNWQLLFGNTNVRFLMNSANLGDL